MPEVKDALTLGENAKLNDYNRKTLVNKAISCQVDLELMSLVEVFKTHARACGRARTHT